MKQDQENAGPGDAYQAGRDIIVHAGLTTDQMSEILVGLAKQLSTFIAEAKSEQERRFADLREGILKEFADPASNANSEAFKDPDFQYVVREAHDVYARNGSQNLKDELIRLVSERSTRKPESRVAKVLNNAIQISGQLSSQEYSILVIMFVLQKVAIKDSLADLIISTLRMLIEPFMSDFPEDSSSLEYLETIGCVNINQISTMELSNIIAEKYTHPLSSGFKLGQIVEACGADAPVNVIMPFLYQDENTPPNFWFSRGTASDLRNDLVKAGLSELVINRLIELHAGTRAPIDDVLSRLRTGIPSFARLEKFYASSGAVQGSVTMTGRAIAHSALVGRAGISAPLEIWVN